MVSGGLTGDANGVAEELMLLDMREQPSAADCHHDSYRSTTVIKNDTPNEKADPQVGSRFPLPQENLVPEKGVEPSTFSLRMSCSTN